MNHYTIIADFLALDKFTRCFYSMTKNLVYPDKSTTIKYRVYYFLDWVALIVGFRFFLYAYIMYNGYKNTVFFSVDLVQSDHLFYYVYKQGKHYDAFAPITAYLFVLFNFICQHLIYRLDANTPTWIFWRQLAVEQQDRYYANIFSQTKREKVYRAKSAALKAAIDSRFLSWIPEKCINFYCYRKAQIETFFRLNNVDKRKLFSEPLESLPEVSLRLQSRVLITMILIDALGLAVQLIIVFLGTWFFLTVAFEINAIFSWYLLPVYFIDILFLFYCLMPMIRCALFFTFCTFIATMIFTGHSEEVRKEVVCLVDKYQKKGKLPYTAFVKLKRFLRVHNMVSYFAVCGSKEIFGLVMFAFMGTNIPINVYMIRCFLYKSISPIDFAMMATVFFGQSMAACSVFVLLAYSCKKFHYPKKVILRVMLMLEGKPWLMLKMKFNDLYYRLNYGIKIAITVGPLHGITYFSALEYLFLYIGYLLMALQSN